HAQLIEKARKGGIDIYFEGDSITRRWGTSDAQYKDFLANWNQNFFGWNAADFGWGADRIENILWRLANGELDGVNPRIIVLLGGTTNPPNTRPTKIVRGIRPVLDLMHQKPPNATIILLGITPRNDTATTVIDAINEINASIANFA